MSPLRLLSAVTAFAALSAAVPVPALGQDAALVRLAQEIPVASLDSTFPAVAFVRWLKDALGRGPDGVRWEVNDCGEGGDGLLAPTCVDAVLDLGPDTTAHASLIVADPDGAPAHPAVWMLYAMTGRSVTHFNALPEWVAYVQGHTH